MYVCKSPLSSHFKTTSLKEETCSWDNYGSEQGRKGPYRPWIWLSLKVRVPLSVVDVGGAWSFLGFCRRLFINLMLWEKKKRYLSEDLKHGTKWQDFFSRSSKPVKRAGLDCHICIKLVAFQDALTCPFDLIIAFCWGDVSPPGTGTESHCELLQFQGKCDFLRADI